MEVKIENLLILPLDKVIKFFRENKLNYNLVEIKPPSAKNNYINKNKNEIKRVLNIKKENDSYQIYWSFQFNK